MSAKDVDFSKLSRHERLKRAPKTAAPANDLDPNAWRRDARRDVMNAAEGLYDVNAVLQLSTDDARRLARFGIHLLLQGRDDEALDCGTVAVAADPHCLDGCLLMANVLSRRKQYKEALDYHVRAQALAPDRVRSWVDAGELRLGLGQYTEAAADFARALALDPKGETAAGARAIALIAKTLMTLGE